MTVTQDCEFSDRIIGVAVLGMGTVGTSVVHMLLDHPDDFAARIGAQIALRGVAVRDLVKDRGIDPSLLTDDPFALITRDDVDIVVEVVGGVDPARKWLLRALNLGKSVITANKVLIADHLIELADAAAGTRADLYYEAAVAGAIPVVRPIQQSLAGDLITRVTGIVNGTTNFILSAMAASDKNYRAALEEATRLGYAEVDPSADVEGFDAAAKTAIIASIAFHSIVNAKDVYREGITFITPEDLRAAHNLGRVVKLLSICELITTDDGPAISARVYPALVPIDHPIGRVDGAMNAVVVDAQYSGQLIFYGQGAGGNPTAGAIMGDVIMAARNKALHARGPLLSDYADLPVVSINDISSRFYIALDVSDRPGVLAHLASVFALADISIATVLQQPHGDQARLVLTTHAALESRLMPVLHAITELDIVHTVSSVMRLEL